MIFREYLKEKFNDEDIIEFGPLNRPLFTREEYKNISYADIRSTEEIKQLYSGNDYLQKTGISVDTNSIIDIDYKIAKGSYVNTFKEKKFDVAYLSHVIEHMPDIINFFTDINKILKDDGKLVIIYPDKRYCFDHYRNSVSFRDAYATYKYGTKENARMAFDFAYNVVHENSEIFFWTGKDITNVISQNNLGDAEKYYQETLNGSIDDDDVHFWPFSDIDFLKFIYEMKRADLFDYEVEEFYPTQVNTQEFMIILKKTTNKQYSDILKLINKYDMQTKENEYKTEIKEKEAKIENFKGCIQNIKKELQETSQKNESLSLANEQMEQRIKKLNLENIEITQEMEELNLKNTEITQKMEEFNLENIQMRQKIEEFNRIIKNYENSKSWKLTAPLRKISRIINGKS